MKVQCPQCHRCAFRTTPAYDPDVRPTKYMVEMMDPWASWGWDNHQGAMSADLCCPLCEAPLAPGGRLHVVPDDYQEVKRPPSLEQRNQVMIDAMDPDDADDDIEVSFFEKRMSKLEHIRSLLLTTDMTHKAIADIVGVSRSYVAQIKGRMNV